jgi:hypothetical protein
MQIPVVTVLPSGAQPPIAVMSRLKKYGSLAGGGCRGRCPSLNGLGFDTGGWTDTLQTVAADWSRIGGQLLLNRNPAPVYQQTARGTTVYAQTGVPTVPTSSGGWVIPALMVGGGLLLVVVMMRNR